MELRIAVFQISTIGGDVWTEFRLLSLIIVPRDKAQSKDRGAIVNSILKMMLVGTVVIAVPSNAQTAVVAENAQPAVASEVAPVAIVPASASKFLKSGTELQLRTLDALTSKKKKSKVGDRFQLEVSDNVVVDGVTVIPSGSKAIGEVTIVKNKGMWGKRGRLTAQVRSLRVGERQVRLTGTFDDSGSAGTAGVVGAAVVLPIAGFFVTGTSAEISSGTLVKAFLDEDVPYIVPLRAVEPAPAG